MDPEEAESHHVGAPLGPGATGAAAGGDAAAIEHDRHVVSAFGLAGLAGHHCGAQMETWEEEGIEKDPKLSELFTGQYSNHGYIYTVLIYWCRGSERRALKSNNLLN